MYAQGTVDMLMYVCSRWLRWVCACPRMHEVSVYAFFLVCIRNRFLCASRVHFMSTIYQGGDIDTHLHTPNSWLWHWTRILVVRRFVDIFFHEPYVRNDVCRFEHCTVHGHVPNGDWTSRFVVVRLCCRIIYRTMFSSNGQPPLQSSPSSSIDAVSSHRSSRCWCAWVNEIVRVTEQKDQWALYTQKN